MNTKQSFGGPWTIEKLNILSDYLNFYVTALKNQPFNLIYIDAFAGTGHINLGETPSEEDVPGQISLEINSNIEETTSKEEIIAGSASLALQAKEQFSHYYFIEKNKKFADELETLIDTEFPHRKPYVEVIKGQDCNEVLLELCRSIAWYKNRAVMFLDPFAANVKWQTLQAIVETHAIDVWYLFPFSAVNRMMTKNGNIDPKWKDKLNSIFGNDSWEKEFYEDDPQISLFDQPSLKRYCSTDKLKAYIEKRLETIFPKVSTHSRVLYNSKHSPLFMFCFAVSSKNESAQRLALKVADHILIQKDRAKR